MVPWTVCFLLLADNHNGGPSTHSVSTTPTTPTTPSAKRSAPAITTPSLPFTPSPSALGSMRLWTQNKLKYTKQYMSEKLGIYTIRTVDTETENKVGILGTMVVIINFAIWYYYLLFRN